MLKARQICDRMNSLYPENLKASYDNVGLMVGSLDKDVKRVFLTLDLTREAMDEALNKHADMIITHHPLIFHPLYSIDTDKDPGSIVRDLIKYDMVLYSMHTNFDAVRMNSLLGEMLNLEDMELLSEKENCGVIGITKTNNLKEFAQMVKKAFSLNGVDFIGNLDVKIERVALCGGSGSSMIMDAYSKNADIYLTGDVSYSRALEAKRLGQNILIIPHFVEHFFALQAEKDLKELDKSIEVIHTEINPDPFTRF